MATIWLAIFACGGPSPVTIPEPPAPDSDAPTGLTTTTDGTTTDGPLPTDTGTGTTGEPPPIAGGFPYFDFDCSLPLDPGPFDHGTLSGTASNEDIALDMDGFLLAADWSANLLRYTYEGDGQLWGTSFGDPTGLEVLPDGDLAVADRSQSRVVVQDYQTGAIEVIATDISWPNGLEVAPDGSILVTDSYAASIYRIDRKTGEMQVVANDIPNADGLALNETYDALYVGTMIGPEILKVPIHAVGDYGPTEVVPMPADVPWSIIDGIQVDRCGNLLLADFYGSVWRFNPTTQEIHQVYHSAAMTIPAIRFGTGLGGWSHLSVFLSTYVEVIEVKIGTPGKVRWPSDTLWGPFIED